MEITSDIYLNITKMHLHKRAILSVFNIEFVTDILLTTFFSTFNTNLIEISIFYLIISKNVLRLHTYILNSSTFFFFFLTLFYKCEG